MTESITTRRKTESSVRTVKFFVKGAPDLVENDNWKSEGRTFTPEAVRVIDRLSVKGASTREVRVTGKVLISGQWGSYRKTVDSNWSNSSAPGSAKPLSEMPAWLADLVAAEVSA